ncbi:hypothetical protein [Candidatus Palauibacter sp.]|uniref:hypothetical protein n=1 Tax=Candidatus Palauibacter sp. TaxID=3101350 RepID=UPI003B02D041
MTAEIAVLNKSAIALAADSVMTVSGTPKRYPGNKLFALSKSHPVGVMFYNNAEFMGIPWEALFKMFRQRIPPGGKPAVVDYAEDFLGHLCGPEVCTDEQKVANLHRIADELFVRVRVAVDDEAEAESTENGDATTLRTVVVRRLADLAAADRASSLQAVDCADLVQRDGESVRRIIDERFGDLDIDDPSRDLLCDLLAATLQSEALSRGHSGVIFAGFGEQELFPSLLEIATDGMIGDALKVVVRQEYDVARDGTRAAIAPFAQSEMVQRFMEGVDPELVSYVQLAAYMRFRGLAQALSGGDADDESDEHVLALNELAETLTDSFLEDVKRFCGERFSQPILTIVRHLPKEELATMAEALVSLTSLKRRVSRDDESVGGPIDVAVISKGDGFIWSKRKHYFDPKLNPDYFARAMPKTNCAGTEA